MTITTTIRTALAAALLAALASAAGTAAASTPPPVLTAGLGCSVQCISKAAVTATATSAKVELATVVPANLVITVSEAPNGAAGGIVASTTKTRTVPAHSNLKLTFFLGLRPDTLYRIVVRATDLQGRSSKRSGTFRTLPVKTAGHGGPTTIDSGAGCSAQCITKALVSQKAPHGTRAKIDIKTSTTAHIQIDVSRDKPVALSGGGLAQFDVVSQQWTASPRKAWAPTVTGLDYGTRYYVVVRARDGQGRVSLRQGSFRTVSATATIMLHRIKILADGDKVGRGELYFSLWLDDESIWATGQRKLDEGDTTNVNPPGSSRPGFAFQVSANGDGEFRMYMYGEDCDAVQKKNCLREAGAAINFADWGRAGGTFRVSKLLEQGALPGWHGTGVTPPAGHDGYFVFGATDRSVRFLVLGTIDLDVDWP